MRGGTHRPSAKGTPHLSPAQRPGTNGDYRHTEGPDSSKDDPRHRASLAGMWARCAYGGTAPSYDITAKQSTASGRESTPAHQRRGQKAPIGSRKRQQASQVESITGQSRAAETPENSAYKTNGHHAPNTKRITNGLRAKAGLVQSRMREGIGWLVPRSHAPFHVRRHW
jgi:hypothetical protein